MAEEADDLVLEESGEQGGAPEGQHEPEQQQEAPAFDAESVARLAGWAPKEEWRGPPEEWKDATTFIADTLQDHKQAKKQVKTLKRTVEQTTRATERLLEQQRREAFEAAERKVREAVQLGDEEAAAEAIAHVRQIEAHRPDRAVQEFAERNADWWQVDPEATAYAVSVAGLRAQQGDAPAEQVAAAEAAVRKRFPELFGEQPQAKPEPRPVPKAPSMSGGQRAAQGRKGPLTLADLPREAQEAAKRFERRGVPLSAFLKSWEEENGR